MSSSSPPPTGKVATSPGRCWNAIPPTFFTAEPTDAASGIRIEVEATEFCFGRDHDVWAVTSAQEKYRKKKLSELRSPVERPCLLETGDGKVIAIAEAAMVDFARMRLRPSPAKPHTLVSKFHGPVVSKLPCKTPWRVIMAGDCAGDLLENNDLFLNLNEPNMIADTSWIKPGKVIRDVTLSTDGGPSPISFPGASAVHPITPSATTPATSTRPPHMRRSLPR